MRRRRSSNSREQARLRKALSIQSQRSEAIRKSMRKGNIVQ